MTARDGDMWCAPFQCEWCWIVNLKKKEANLSEGADTMLLGYLRRMNLDLMWSREPSTVRASLSQLVKGARMSEEMGLLPVDIPRGPWPVDDLYGCQVALEILRASQLSGKNDSGYQQFETIRKLRSGFANAFESSPCGANGGNVGFRGDKGKVYTMQSIPTDSVLFNGFMTGLLSRMGRLILQDVGIDNLQVHALINELDAIVGDGVSSWEVKRTAIMDGAFYLLLYGCSLRGYEGLYLERSEFLMHIEDGKNGVFEADGTLRAEGHVCAPLLGKFKNEDGEQHVMMIMVNESKSKLKFRLWMERLAFLLSKEGWEHTVGPAFCHLDGSMIYSWEFNDHFVNQMDRLKSNRPDLFLTGIDIRRTYSVSRSFRRGSNTRAKEEGVPEDVRNLINRWSTVEAKKGKKPSMSMTNHYLETKLILKRTLVYSKAL